MCARPGVGGSFRTDLGVEVVQDAVLGAADELQQFASTGDMGRVALAPWVDVQPVVMGVVCLNQILHCGPLE